MFALHSEPVETAAPTWLALPLGVRLRVRPLDAAIVAAARRRALRTIAELLEQQRAGGRFDASLPDLTDPDLAEAVFQREFAAALARYGALDWEGVGDMGDPPQALPFSRDAAERLGRHAAMSEALIREYLATLDRPAEPALRPLAQDSTPAPSTPDSGNRRQRRAEAARHRKA